jgi:uncharacterized membrane protein YfcA
VADLTPYTFVVVLMALSAAGVVKGILGIGLPMVAVSIMATVVPVTSAVAVVFLPMILSNLWQAYAEGHHQVALRRFWPLLIGLAIGTLIGNQILVRADPDKVILFLGLVVIAFCASSLFQERFRIPPEWERWLAPVVGLGAGFVGGFSAFFGPLMVMYLVALKLDRDEFVGSVALANFTGAVVLYGSLAGMGRLALPEIGASALALVPVLLGMEVGRRLRRHIEAELFRLALLLALLVMGLNLVRRSVM